MYEGLFQKIRTGWELDQLSSEIVLLQNSLYEDKGEVINNVLNNKIRSWVAKEMALEMEIAGMSWSDYLEGLEKRMAGLDKVFITLAFEPSDYFLQKIHQIICTMVGKYVILDIGFDSSIIGGVILHYKGLYADYSFRRIFEKNFSQSRAMFLKVLEGSNKLPRTKSHRYSSALR